ncbi:MFS general substrate transporter [Zopfia rhizophila CBS 207.26]|uniref:MFS general substrate transporter n=1 Tax=Zopfia rhizophila CBS 207.26 TaxID=1314779 RepID=A0A6A6E5I6_9PEZI|nr:MFS general substrate transporter [Zopfia rhizophila CBS 207.26]
MAQDETEGVGNEITTQATPSAVPNISPVRLQVIIAGLWLSLFMSALDTTIITTALIKISSDYNAFGQAAWLVTTYLLTYNCKFPWLEQKINCDRIVLRAFQGIGGSGLYSLVFVTLMKIITPEKMGFYSGIISSVFALANLLGPIIGGLISDRTTWRWIFWINGPIVVAAIILLFSSMPGLADGKSNRERLRAFDTIGGILSVSWLIPLLFALQEGGANYTWNSSVIIGTLTAGLGMPFYVAVIQLPQRFQAVNHTSAERAGILLLPLTLLTPVGAMLAGVIMGKHVTAEYILMISTAIVSIGIGLLSTLPTGHNFTVAAYGYEIITGIGLGAASPPYYFLLASSLPEPDIATGTGTLNMLRTLGGCIAVAICSALQHSSLRTQLPSFLSLQQVSAVEDSITAIMSLPPEAQRRVGEVFAKSYNKQYKVMLAFTLLNFLAAVTLGVVRKRKGLFGVVPVRKEGNEFLKGAEEDKGEEKGKLDGRKGVEVKGGEEGAMAGEESQASRKGVQDREVKKMGGQTDDISVAKDS